MGHAFRILALVAFGLATASAVGAAPPYFDRWQSFTTADGLPSDKASCVLAAGDEVWVGTDRGLAVLRGSTWTAYTRKDGLVHDGILSLAVDPDSGDVWIGTMGGASRWSGGRFENFTQLDSGLANNVVYGLTVHRGEVWLATASGTSRYQIAADRWTIYDQSNTTMHEPWCYSAAAAGEKVYIAAWAGGLLEFDLTKEAWKRYQDPDGEMEIDLFRDDGIVHDVVSSVTVDAAERVWIATYFGLSSYDGRTWRSFMDHDSPLTSNFINFARAHGNDCYLGTDKGLSVTDRENWWTYRRNPETGKGAVAWHPASGSEESFTTDEIFPHEFINGIAIQGETIWLATEQGVAHGWRSASGSDARTGRSDAPPNERPDAASPGIGSTVKAK